MTISNTAINILFIAGLLAPSTRAFVTTRPAGRPGWITTSSSSPHSSPGFLQATVFGADGSVVFDDEDGSATSFMAPPTEPGANRYAALMDFFHRESMDLLARLAVAFSPAERALKLKDIENVQVLNVDEHHISIEATLCENQGCVSLQVPVTFPQPCVTNSKMEDVEGCIVDNLGALNIQAEELLTKSAISSNPEAAAAAEKEMQMLKSHEGEFQNIPYWWVPPPSEMENAEMAEECRVVKDLLNEDDFAGELRVLSNRALGQQPQQAQGIKMVVRQVTVASIGPAGMLLRASVQEVPLQVYDEHFENDMKHAPAASSSPYPVKIWELPLAFGKVATTVNDLRADVLGMVATAEGVSPS